MLLKLIYKLAFVKRIVKGTLLGRAYAASIGIAMRGFLFAYFLILIISMYFWLIGGFIDLLEIYEDMGFIEFIIPVVAIVLGFLPGVIAFVFSIDILIVGLRAKGQIIIGNLFYTENFANSRDEFLSEIEG